jgi:hypothetical protein
VRRAQAKLAPGVDEGVSTVKVFVHEQEGIHEVQFKVRTLASVVVTVAGAPCSCWRFGGHVKLAKLGAP